MTTKKLFTLISGETVHLSPDDKLLRAEEFSQALDVIELMEKVKVEVAEYKAQVARECEVLKEQAQKEGFEEGFNAWAERLITLEQEVRQSHKETEKVILPVALQAAKKILGRELELSPTTITDIVAVKLRVVAQSKRVTVHVNPKEYEKVDKERPRLRELFEKLESFSIRPREDIEPGGCVIETESGIINAQLERQWEIIEQAFLKLAEPPQ